MYKNMPGYTRSELTDDGCALFVDGRARYRLIPADSPVGHYRAVFHTSGNGASPEGYTRWSREDVLAIPVQENVSL
jgi:hypothetical protein